MTPKDRKKYLLGYTERGTPVYAVSGGVDNVTIPATGSGTATPVVATDDVAGVHYQKVKIIDGTAEGTAAVAADATNGLDVDVTRMSALVAGTANIGDVDIASPLGAGTEAAAVRVTLATDSTGLVSVDDNGGNISVDWAGTVPPIGAGTEAAALRVTVATDSTGVLSVDDNAGSLTVDQGAAGTAWEVIGDVAHDVGAPVNPVVIGGQMETMADSAPGTRAGTDGDAVKLASTDGALFVVPTGPQTWSYHENSSSALTDASVHVAPAAGLSLYVTSIVFSTGAATAWNIFFEEGVTTVLGPWYLEAIAGRGANIYFATPKKITAATALTVTTSAAIAHSIDVTGFIAPG